MKLRFAPRAAQDLLGIATYLRGRNPAAARRVQAAIAAALDHVMRFPLSGRAQQVEGTRKHVVRRYPYLIYYKVNERAGEVVIVAVQHAARRRRYRDA